MNIFYYENETFGIELIASNFLQIFKKAYIKEQNYFLDSLNLEREELIDNINDLIGTNVTTIKVLKSVSQDYLKNKKSFDSYYIANMYYKLPMSSQLSKSSASIILKFHISIIDFYKTDNELDLTNIIRYFVHLVEVLECLNINNIKYTDKQNSNYIESVLQCIIKTEIETIKHDKYDYALLIDENIYGINSHFIVKNLKLINGIHSFQEFYNKSKKVKKHHISRFVDTTQKNKRYVKDEYFITKARKNLEPLSLEDRIEEDNSLKESIEVKIQNSKNSKTKQSKKILAISASISKNKLQLPSLYSIPSIGYLSSFLKEIILKDTNNENSFYIGIFIISIIMGIKPKKLLNIFFSKKKYNSDKNTIELHFDGDFFAKYDRFTKSVGIETIKKIRYKIPFEIMHYISHLRGMNIDFDENNFKKIILKLKKESKLIMHINFNKIWNCSLIHKKLISSNINTEILLASQNIDQNTTSMLAYTAIPVDMQEYSNWLNEYIDILDLKSNLQKFLFGKTFSKEILIDSSIKTEMMGSKKLVKREILIEFLEDIANLLKERRLDQYARFNIYSIYVRYVLSILLGTRDFSISVDLSRISWKKNVIIIKEKGKYKNAGYRAIPLCTLSHDIIKNYLSILNRLGIADRSIVLYHKGVYLSSTLVNIKKVFKAFDFYNRYHELYERIDLIPLNVGRHIITTMATAAGINRDDMNAFMGHAINGGELLGIYSFHNTKKYSAKFEVILNEISEIYQLKDIYTNVKL